MEQAGKSEPDATPHANCRAESRHGEYKTPGGKLVVVDFRVQGGCLTDVQIAGDFFLYPDEALLRLRDSLEGAAAGSASSELEASLVSALAAGDELVGVTPAAVAAAVTRALAERP